MMLLGGPYFSELGQFYFWRPGDEAAKDGFLLNTLKILFRLSRVVKQCHQICTFSVILEEYECITSRLRSLGIIFPNILDAI